MKSNALKRGTVLVYTLVLVVLGVFMATVILNVATELSLEYDARNIETSLINTIKTKSDLSMKYARELNNSGSGYIDSIGCPQNFTMSGTTVRTTGINSTIKFLTGSITCQANYNSNQVYFYFNAEYSDIQFAEYQGTQVALSSSNPTNTFTDASTTFIDVTSSYPLLPDGIDDNFDSDNYSINSTGSIFYPDKYIDNDADAKLMNYGYIIENSGLYNVFWSNETMRKYITSNTSNINPIHSLLGSVSSGYLYLDINSPYRMILYKINKLSYVNFQELIVEQVITGTGQIADIGYLQNDLSLASGTGSAYNFDFINNDYALFIENTSSGALLYKVRGENALTGSGIYINPLNDSNPSILSYLGGHILINETGKLIATQLELFGLKADNSVVGATPSGPSSVASYSMDSLFGTVIGTPQVVVGHTANALQFYGSPGDGILLGKPSSLNITGAITLSAWVNTLYDQGSGWGRVISRTNGTTGEDWGIIISTTKQLDCRFGGSYARSSTNVVAKDGVWHHLACTYDGSTIRAYVDGVQVASTSATVTLSTANDVSIGYNATGGATRYFYGKIDDVRVYNSALNSSEISDLHSGSF